MLLKKMLMKTNETQNWNIFYKDFIRKSIIVKIVLRLKKQSTTTIKLFNFIADFKIISTKNDNQL